MQQESPWRPVNGIPEVTNAWLSLAHDEFGADAGPVARRRHPDFLRTVQFVLPGVARARRPQTIAVIADPERRTQTRARTVGLRAAPLRYALGAYRTNARQVDGRARLR